MQLISVIAAELLKSLSIAVFSSLYKLLLIRSFAVCRKVQKRDHWVTKSNRLCRDIQKIVRCVGEYNSHTFLNIDFEGVM